MDIIIIIFYLYVDEYSRDMPSLTTTLKALPDGPLCDAAVCWYWHKYLRFLFPWTSLFLYPS